MAGRGLDNRPVLPDLIDTYLRTLLIAAIMGVAAFLVAIWDHGLRAAMSPAFLVALAKEMGIAAILCLPVALLLIAEERRADRAARRARDRTRED